ncbi:hypothetical protein [Paenibacillus sp. PAMC21692]|uniref:hypothetical protein n=1 Tax=Paenibacillus sp. PAMC21692 TaxID=2762320 RepID=UPI00164CE37B|nr:hypothetical protein [Paenibacillus sp. PAMC21692]QNK56000.1 hypothetical protein H7F31_25980 [Paenibacillus sp. PAMC21692]
MEKEQSRNRLDRLKHPGPLPSINGKSNGSEEQEAGEPAGPPQGNEEWRTLYERIREATEKLRD